MIALLAAAVLSAGLTLIQEGGDLYAVHCVNCHGPGAAGLRGVGAAAVDFYLKTGRMPLEVAETEPMSGPPQFTPTQIAAITAFVVSHGAGNKPPIPAVHPGNIVRGRILFEENCQACHGPTGDSAVVGFGWIAPPLPGDDPVQVAESVRIGPGIMPRFDERMLSEPDLDALVTFVVSLRTPPNRGGLSVASAGPVGEGLLAWVLGLGSIVVLMRLVGETLKDR